MNIRQMEYLLALAERRTLSDAARACFISQSALSQSLAKLESSLGVSLFLRHKNTWTPTDAGLRYLEAASRIVAERDALLHDLDVSKRRGAQTIKLGMTLERSALVFPLVYPRFREEFPGTRLLLEEEHVFRLQQMLLRGELDMAVSVAPLAHQDDMVQMLDLAPVVTEEFVLIVPPSHELARQDRAEKGEGVCLREIAGETLILPPKSKALWHVIDEALKAASVVPLESFDVRSTHAMVEFVSKGMGVSLVPRMFAAGNPSIRIIPLTPKITWNIGVLFRRGRSLSGIEQRLVAIIREVFESLLHPPVAS